MAQQIIVRVGGKLPTSSRRISTTARPMVDFLANRAGSEPERAIQLVCLTIAEMGFKQPTARSDINAKARALGLLLCPAEVGPHLLMQYREVDLHIDHLLWHYIAMEPIVVSRNSLAFCLGHSRNTYTNTETGEVIEAQASLSAVYGDPSNHRQLEDIMVYWRP